MTGRCIIIAAGSFYGLPFALEEDDLLIAADAGYRYCREAGLVPDVVLGDFDSMPLPDHPDCLRYPVEKDDTDTMLAMKKGLEAGCLEFHILGGTGGERLDHTLANLQSLSFLASRGARGFLYDKNQVYTVIRNDRLRVPGAEARALLSVFSLGGEARGVSLKGVQYSLENGTLSPDFPLGVSNHILEKEAEVSVNDGTLLVGWQWP